MKLSWGYKILFGYTVFVAGIVFLVVKASSQKFDLVSKDYYEEELKYQDIIDQSANTANLSAPLIVDQTATEVRIALPPEMKGKKKSINFYLYCAADAKRDLRKKFEITENEILQPLPAAMSGMYELKLSWRVEGVYYYFEKKLFF